VFQITVLKSNCQMCSNSDWYLPITVPFMTDIRSLLTLTLLQSFNGLTLIHYRPSRRLTSSRCCRCRCCDVSSSA